MELFRTISPNGGSISRYRRRCEHAALRAARLHRQPHTSTSLDPRALEEPGAVRPVALQDVPTSHEIDEAKCEQIGFAKCPFDQTAFDVKDGRKAAMTTVRSARSTALSTASRCRSATMRALRRSASATAAARASSSPSRSSRTSCARYGRAEFNSSSSTLPIPNRCRLDRRQSSATMWASAARPEWLN